MNELVNELRNKILKMESINSVIRLIKDYYLLKGYTVHHFYHTVVIRNIMSCVPKLRSEKTLSELLEYTEKLLIEVNSIMPGINIKFYLTFIEYKIIIVECDNVKNITVLEKAEKFIKDTPVSPLILQHFYMSLLSYYIKDFPNTLEKAREVKSKLYYVENKPLGDYLSLKDLPADVINI